MAIEHVTAGENVPDVINVVIEIAADSTPIKYEMDKNTGLITVDRFLGTSMHYPCNYGYVPQTLSDDGDPADVLVVTPYPLVSGCLIQVRPVGILRMTDESGIDAKILAVPIDKLAPRYATVIKPTDLGDDLLARIVHFFTHYKDLEPGKWAKIDKWESVDIAKAEIIVSVKRYQEQMVEA